MRTRIEPIPNPWKLSGMQCKVVGFIVEGLTAREIADEMCIETRTVKTHLQRLARKMGAGRTILAALEWDRFTRGASV
jgi:DNA-binding NarL/FixJ family response regulator